MAKKGGMSLLFLTVDYIERAQAWVQPFARTTGKIFPDSAGLLPRRPGRDGGRLGVNIGTRLKPLRFVPPVHHGLAKSDGRNKGSGGFGAVIKGYHMLCFGEEQPAFNHGPNTTRDQRRQGQDDRSALPLDH